MKKIIAFSGSNSSTSINQQLATYSASLIGFDTELIDLRTYDTPIYSADLEAKGIPSTIEALATKLAGADGFVISSPEHNGSLTAFFKNMIDWLSRFEAKFLGNKPVLLLSTSPGGYGGANALADLEGKLKYFGGELASKYSLGSFSKNFNVQERKLSNDEELAKLKLAIAAFEEKLS